MNVMIAAQSPEATHVAAPRIIRTQKFITAIANGVVVISTEFVDKCLDSSKRPDPNKYLLKDKEGEHNLGCTLSVVRERALANKGQLLKGYHVFSTENNFDIYKAICEANGGKCLLFKGRSQSLSITRRATEDDDSDAEQTEDPERKGMVYLVSSAEAEDKKLWPKFNSMALDAEKTPRIVKNDWLTAALLRQKIEWHDDYRQQGSSVG